MEICRPVDAMHVRLSVLSRMTPRLITREGNKVLSTEIIELSADFLPVRRFSVLSPFNLRMFEENQDLSSLGQLIREEHGKMELGLLER